MIGDVKTHDLHGRRVLECATSGSDLEGDAVARALIGEAIGAGADWLVLPTSRLSDAFFDLSTRIAGEMLQKFVNYRIGVAIVGDIEARVEGSTSLRDFVRESNRSASVWFLPNTAAFEQKLAARNAP